MRGRAKLLLGTAAASYGALVVWAHLPMRGCGSEDHLFRTDCEACMHSSALELLPPRVVSLLLDLSVPEMTLQRLLDVEWTEGTLRTWPHCCTQGGCWMHHDEPFCRCACRWCALARRFNR